MGDMLSGTGLGDTVWQRTQQQGKEVSGKESGEGGHRLGQGPGWEPVSEAGRQGLGSGTLYWRGHSNRVNTVWDRAMGEWTESGAWSGAGSRWKAVSEARSRMRTSV